MGCRGLEIVAIELSARKIVRANAAYGHFFSRAFTSPCDFLLWIARNRITGTKGFLERFRLISPSKDNVPYQLIREGGDR